jgi:hypothetical protein
MITQRKRESPVTNQALKLVLFWDSRFLFAIILLQFQFVEMFLGNR